MCSYSAAFIVAAPHPRIPSSVERRSPSTVSTNFCRVPVSASVSPQTSKHSRPPRRAFLSLLLSTSLASVLPSPSEAVELYKVGQIRYIPTGRPSPIGPPPAFSSDKSVFAIGETEDGVDAQDVRIGEGKLVSRGSLVVARWDVRLDDGTVVEQIDREIFRAGVGVVYPGIDVAVIGMAGGGIRRVRAPATSFFSDIMRGERALVETTRTVFADIELLNVDPFGNRR